MFLLYFYFILLQILIRYKSKLKSFFSFIRFVTKMIFKTSTKVKGRYYENYNIIESWIIT